MATRASQRSAQAASRPFERDPDALYEVREDHLEPTCFDVNWGYWGMRSSGLDVVRWTTAGTVLSEADAQRLFELGEEVCAAVADYTGNVRPGDAAGVKEYGLSAVLAPMGFGRELRLRAQTLPDGGFEISNYDVADDWRAVVSSAA